MTKTNKFNDGEFQEVCNDISTSVLIVKITMVGTFQESAHSLQNNHENNSVEQKHSKREHHILFWIKMATHLWILTIRS